MPANLVAAVNTLPPTLSTRPPILLPMSETDTVIAPVEGTVSLLLVSDFVCPWCYIGLIEAERLEREYDIEIRHAPYLLDPRTPPEGKPRKPMTRPEDPPTEMELRAESLGIKFARGRTWTSNTLLSHEGLEFAHQHGKAGPYARAMFKAYFEDLADIGKQETVLDVAESVGLDRTALKEALDEGVFRQEVIDGISWAREIGISGVPAFIFEEKWLIPGAQDHEVFASILAKLGKEPRA